LLWLQQMYSRKFGVRLQGKRGNLLKTADYPGVTDWERSGGDF